MLYIMDSRESYHVQLSFVPVSQTNDFLFTYCCICLLVFVRCLTGAPALALPPTDPINRGLESSEIH